MRRLGSCILLHILLFASCSKEANIIDDLSDKNNQTVLNDSISFVAEVPDGVSSRAYWEEQTNGSLWFHWQESSEEMKFLVYDTSKDAFKTFNSSTSVYSKMKVIPTEQRNKATLHSLSTIDGEYADNDKIFAYSPVDKISYDSEKVRASIDMDLPLEFAQTEENSTKHISPYLFMSGLGVVSSKEARLSFNILPVIIRLKVSNKTSSEINVSSVAIEGKFCTQAKIVLDSGYENIVYTVPDTNNKITVKSNMESILSGGSTSNLYCLLFPVTLKKTDNLTFYITGEKGLDYKKTVECSKLISSEEGQLSFKANHYYTFNVNVTPNGMEVLQVTVDDFVTGQDGVVTDTKSCWFVTPEGKSTGTSWENAGALTNVLSKANDGDMVYLAAGDYNIVAQTTLKYNLSIIGGYVGNEENLNNPNPKINKVNFIGGENTRCFNIANSSKESGTLKISGINFKNFNFTSTNSGGVINIASSISDIIFEDLTFTDCSVLHDDTNGSNGGAIYINSYDGETIFNIIRCKFYNCAAKNGGAIYLNNVDVNTGKTLNILDCIFIGNTSTANGGAMHVRTGNIINIRSSVFSGNIASTLNEKGSGGCVYMHFSNNLNVVSSTMYENEASQKGSAIYGNGDNEATQNLIAISNTIVIANNASRTTSSRWALEADNIGVNNIFVIHNSIVANNINAGGKVADLAVLNASESNIITNSIVNNKYLENGIATDTPSSGTYVNYLNDTQLTELKSKIGISDNEIQYYVKEF